MNGVLDIPSDASLKARYLHLANEYCMREFISFNRIIRAIHRIIFDRNVPMSFKYALSLQSSLAIGLLFYLNGLKFDSPSLASVLFNF